jgi:protein involved in polysaccharide export with SLBB domain
MKSTYTLGCLGLSLLLLAGCASTKPAAAPLASSTATTQITAKQPAAELLNPPSAPFTLGPGDRIEVELLGDAASRTELTLGPDGKIYFQMLPGLDISGLTLRQTKTELEKALGEYLKDPQVSVNLRDVKSKHVWLMGRVGQPGLYPLTGPMTLVEALTLAGGTSQSTSLETTEELADLRHSFVIRQGEMLPVDFDRLLRQGDMKQNIYLQADDFVFVPSSLSKEVFVLGAVRLPTAVPYRDNLTLVAAISTTGGFIPKISHGTHVAIVRGSLSQPVVSVVDVSAIMRGAAPDVVLEPRDIVYVPDSPYKTLNRYVEMIVNTFVGTVAANEGIRAIDPNGIGVGINVPVGK